MKVRRFAAWINLTLSAVLALLIWVMIVWVASRPALKVLFDLTPQRVNSVDPATVDLLRELRSQKAKIEFHEFYPPMAGQGSTIQEQQELQIRERLRELTHLLLVRYQAIGGESVTVFSHDFYNATADTREAAQKFDFRDAESDVLVVSVQMPGKERRFKKLSLLLDLGRVEVSNVNANGGPTPRAPAAVLKAYKGEESISSTIKSLLVEGTPVAYVLTDYSPLFSDKPEGSGGYGALLAALRRGGFDVRPLSLRNQGVPDDATIVLVFEPMIEFTDRDATTLFAYVQRGGRIFLNYSWSPVSESNPTGGHFGELLGYELSKEPVFHLIPDRDNRTGGPGLDGNNAVSKLQLLVSRGHPTTKRIAASGRPMEVAIARELRERAGAPPAIRREALLSTNKYGWLAKPGRDGYPSNVAPPANLLRAFIVGLACEVDVPETVDKHAPGSPSVGEVVIVSGVFCSNAGMPLFGDLALNICNWMAERKVLLDLKDTGYEAKYLQVQLPQILRVRDLLMYGVPVTFLLCGMVVFFLRRRQ